MLLGFSFPFTLGQFHCGRDDVGLGGHKVAWCLVQKRNDKYKTWLSIRGHVLTFELEVLKLDHYLVKVAY